MASKSLSSLSIAAGILRGGAWNASIVAEHFHFDGQTISTIGLGSTISRATDSGDINLLIATTIAMAATVVSINRLSGAGSTAWHRRFTTWKASRSLRRKFESAASPFRWAASIPLRQLAFRVTFGPKTGLERWYGTCYTALRCGDGQPHA